MRSLSRVLVVGVVAVVLSGCWPTPGAGPDRRNFNPYERTLTPGNVGELTEAFRAPLDAGAGPPVVTPSGLYVRTGLSIAAFEPGTGVARWTARLPDFEGGDDRIDISDPFVIDAQDQVVATMTVFGPSFVRWDTFVTLASDTGAVQRSLTNGRLDSVRGPVAAVVGRDQCCAGMGDRTRIGVGFPPGQSTWGGYAPDLVDGRATLGRGVLYVTSEGRIHSYDTTAECGIAGGDPICVTEWIRPIATGITPVVIGDDATLYVASGDSRAYAVDSGSGEVRWSTGVGAPVSQTPALADDVLYVAANDGRLTAVPAGGCGLADCPASWTTSAGSRLSVQPAVAGGVVYTGAADGTVAAFDAAGCGSPTCQPLWSTNTGAPITGGLAIYGGRLYVGTQTGLVSYGLPPA